MVRGLPENVDDERPKVLELINAIQVTLDAAPKEFVGWEKLGRTISQGRCGLF